MKKGIGAPPERPPDAKIDAKFSFKISRELKNKSLTPCFFCRNGFGKRRHYFTIRNRKFAVCSYCLTHIGRGRVMQILGELPFPLNNLNYRSPARLAELDKIAEGSAKSPGRAPAKNEEADK